MLLIVVSVILNTGCSKENDLVKHTKYPIDGPYLFDHPDGYNSIYVDSDRWVKQKIITDDVITVISALDPGLSFQVTIRDDLTIDSYEHNTDKKVLAVSDIEGNLPVFLEFLVSNQVIDEKLEWAYGKNHLVIIGDLFDRGVDVTALLWYVYKLEAEAIKHGGKVHFLLGNHDTMVLNGDHTYTRFKYIDLSRVVGVSLDNLFGDKAVLGRWIRTKNTIEKINGVIYNHAGISYEFFQKNFTINDVNQKIRDYLGTKVSQICANDADACFLYGLNGPLWYNGYFYQNGIKQQQIEYILNQLDANHIVVGHSKVEKLQVLFDKAIIAIDTHTTSKNNLGEYSESYIEGLLIEDGIYYRINNLGDKEIF